MEKDIKIPQHVAIILDGNGRWAKSKGMPRNYGHAQGAKTVETICREAWNMGIKYLTASPGRGGRADEASAELYEELSEDRGEESHAGSRDRRQDRTGGGSPDECGGAGGGVEG